MSFCDKIKKELCQHDKNNFKFDLGEIFALFFYKNLKNNTKHDYINQRFVFLCNKNLIDCNLDHKELNKLVNTTSIKKNNNLKQGFLTGKFICSGVFSNPNKNYNLEFFNNKLSDAEFLYDILYRFKIESKIIKRKSYFVNYIHDAELISKFLSLIKANKALMDFENIRIIKDLRNNINRNINFETANLNKTITAAINKISDINYIISKKGIDYLPKDLKKIAIYRLKFQDASLKELGEKFTPPLTKSYIYYKLNTISKIAKYIKKNNK